MNPKLEALLQSIREIFPRLSPADRSLLYWTIADLKAEAAERDAAASKDPMCKAFAKGLARIERDAADAIKPKSLPAIDLDPPEPNQ